LYEAPTERRVNYLEVGWTSSDASNPGCRNWFVHKLNVAGGRQSENKRPCRMREKKHTTE